MPAPTGLVIALPRSAYRRIPVRVSRFRLLLSCIRHPIIAFAAWRALEPVELLSEREERLLVAAAAHGLVGWWLATHT